MDERNSFNDVPISLPEDDLFGIDPFAQALAKSIKGLEAPVGTTIAINGKWGSGKSSAINLIKHHLARNGAEKDLEIVNFNCWWFRGEEALTLSFFQELYVAMKPHLKWRQRKLVTKLAKKVMQFKAVIGPTVSQAAGRSLGALTEGGLEIVADFIEKSETIEKVFQDLYKALEGNNERYLVIIDDIDRLTPDEALLIFRLIKSIGRLPNVIYLLALDRVLAEKTVKSIYPSEGPHYLEKIIQASFDLPVPILLDVEEALLATIENICEIKFNQNDRYYNRIVGDLLLFIKLPRDVIRLSNVLRVAWPAVKGEVHVVDFIAMETIRLFELHLYYAVRNSKKEIFQKLTLSKQEKHFGEVLESLSNVVNEKDRERSRLILLSLFPGFRSIETSNDAQEARMANRRICTPEHFDTYFRLSVGLETIPEGEFEKRVARTTRCPGRFSD